MILMSLTFFWSLVAQKGPTAETVATNALSAPDAASLYTYNPFGKRDPFRSFLAEKREEMAASNDPLLNWDLSRFSLTGVLWGIANPKGIVKDGDGRGHIVSRGTRMGRNRGSVVKILKDEIIVQEEFRDPLGKLMVSEFSLKLEKKGLKK